MCMYVLYKDRCCSREHPQFLHERHRMIFTLFPLALNSGSQNVSFLELAITIAFVLPSLTFIFQLSAQARILSISSCIKVLLLPLILPTFIQYVVSSAKRLAIVSISRSTSMSLMNIRNKSGDMALIKSEGCGSHSINFHPRFASTEEMSDISEKSKREVHLQHLVDDSISPDFVVCFLIFEECC